MIEVRLWIEPEGEVSILNVSGDLTLEARAEMMHDCYWNWEDGA